MTPDQIRETLAAMPPGSPDRCLYTEHRWTLWRPLSDDRHDRRCRQCGAVQEQAGDGTLSMIADPYGIEQRRGQE